MKPFLHVSLGISALLLTGSLFVRSILPAHAEPPKPEMILDEGDAGNGRYQVSSWESAANKESDVVILDTKTGKTVVYSRSTDTYKAAWEKMDHQLPATPFAE